MNNKIGIFLFLLILLLPFYIYPSDVQESIYGCPYCEWVSAEIKPPALCPFCAGPLEALREASMQGPDKKSIIFNKGECKTCEYPAQWVAIYSCPEGKRSFSPFKCPSTEPAKRAEVRFNYYCLPCENYKYSIYYSKQGNCVYCGGKRRQAGK